MSYCPKIDNSDLQAKLDLRRYFLRKYSPQPDVLDCCQGRGKLWTELRREFTVKSYWGVDVMHKKGRLKLDSIRILEQAGWPQNVIDIDTYGSPWKHWIAMLPNVTKPVTVFLTIGSTWFTGATDNVVLKAIGLAGLANRLPRSLRRKVETVGTDHMLGQPLQHGLTVLEAMEAMTDVNARYIGIRVAPGG